MRGGIGRKIASLGTTDQDRLAMRIARQIAAPAKISGLGVRHEGNGCTVRYLQDGAVKEAGITSEAMEKMRRLTEMEKAQVADPNRSRRAIRVPTAAGLLRLATLLLPQVERDNWLEEQRGYLADLSTRRTRWMWTLQQAAAMPRYAYTVRTGWKKEPV